MTVREREANRLSVDNVNWSSVSKKKLDEKCTLKRNQLKVSAELTSGVQ